MKRESRISQILFWISFCYIPGLAQVEHELNVALKANIQANTTCGSPAEKYYNIQQINVQPIKRNLSWCNASDPAMAHPPTNLVDGSLDTFWQSKATQDIAYITIDLGQVITSRFNRVI